jgi:hypothetical protein
MEKEKEKKQSQSKWSGVFRAIYKKPENVPIGTSQ